MAAMEEHLIDRADDTTERFSSRFLDKVEGTSIPDFCSKHNQIADSLHAAMYLFVLLLRAFQGQSQHFVRVVICTPIAHAFNSPISTAEVLCPQYYLLMSPHSIPARRPILKIFPV